MNEEPVFPDAARKGGGVSFWFNQQKTPDNDHRDNDSFFTREKGDRSYPDKLMKTHGAEGEATDSLTTPLLPSIKRREDNALDKFLEGKEIRNTTKNQPVPKKKVEGWEGKLR